jgi:4-hydroxy-4-methyl-2-oxoglutarate aldolase
MANQPPDNDIFSLLSPLSTSLIGDILDTLSYHNQFLPQSIKPLNPSSQARIVGRAMPVLETDISPDEDQDKPFGLMLEALDSLQPNEIYLATGSTSQSYALFGGLMSTRAKHLGAAGAVLNGYVRDADEIADLNFPVFSRGLYAQDQSVRGKVANYRCEVEIEGIHVRPGDLVFGDQEGVVIIPREVEGEVVRKANEKGKTENQVAEAIKKGMSAVEAFEKFGVL